MHQQRSDDEQPNPPDLLRPEACAPGMKQMRILLIEDHPVVRAGCRRLLQMFPKIEVLEADNGTQGLQFNAEARPKIIVLDLYLSDAPGLSLMPDLQATNPTARIGIFTMYDEPIFVRRALDAGAIGFVSKNDEPEALITMIEKVNAGKIYLSTAVLHKLALTRRVSADL